MYIGSQIIKWERNICQIIFSIILKIETILHVLHVSSTCTNLSCSLEHPPSGRKMDVFTTEPGLQCYTGCNMKPEVFGKGGVEYPKLASVCLETQHYANSVNQASQFNSCKCQFFILTYKSIKSNYNLVYSQTYCFLMNNFCFSVQLPQYDPPAGSNIPSHHCIQIRTGVVMLYHCRNALSLFTIFFFISSMSHYI